MSKSRLTMPSVDMAGLTGKRHSDVLESIRRVLKKADIDSTEFSAQCKPEQINLTPRVCGSMLYSPLPHEADGICNPYRQGVKTPSKGVFLCPPFRTALNSCSSRYGVVIGGASRLAAPCRGIANPFNHAARRFATLSGGYFSFRQGYPL